jgi:hypothetical protein
MISVHSFKRWDHAKGEYYFPKFKATEAAIKARRGVIIPETEEKITADLLDWQGRYDASRRKGVSHGQFV